ncbi:MAG: Asp-tRNA(Asn)/Glu-tRNA(Gln) amidotransferase subunit GatB [Gammaproteobacteria bacterium]|nr:Asp-tRNA(Asn)/Glu-tRNA(Gln) amidotransferase subunit GatB [Gammaproteobacteria bacterium]
MTWETVIGLEVHAQLNTQTKLFSNAPTHFGATPNTQANVIDAGFPGTLPVLNQKAMHLAIQFGLAIEATINQLSYFERKNYVYPDLPKGYQISQYRRPIVSDGHLMIPSSEGEQRVEIERAHLEEDAGKSLHNHHHTAIDLNRSGMPLLEIVTTPCLSSAQDAVTYLKTLNQLLRFLNCCSGNMQEGAFRCDVNLSLKRTGTKTLGTRVELKNLNSYRFIEKAILFEQHRQAMLLDAKQTVMQETRLYHEASNTTVSMREKEDTADYRYFPDPDLLPLFIEGSLLQKLRSNIPELPNALRKRLQSEGITNCDDLEYLLSSPALFQFYDTLKQHCHAPVKLLVNWLKGPLAAELKSRHQHFENISIRAERFGDLLTHLDAKKINDKQAKSILPQLFDTDDDVVTLISANGYASQTQVDFKTLQDQLLAQFPEQIAQYQAGEARVISFLIGQAMKLAGDHADPKEIHAFLTQSLSKKQ